MSDLPEFSYDDLIGRFTGALDTERDAVWRAGDVVTRALDDLLAALRSERLTKRDYRRTRKTILAGMAEAGHCTVARVCQLGAVSGAFGTEQRYPECSWTFYRAVLAAAKRTGRDPRELLDEARDRGWHVADLNQLGKEIAAASALREACADCGSTVTVRVEGSTAAALRELPALPCPTCVARKWRDGADAREARRLGVLEAA